MGELFILRKPYCIHCGEKLTHFGRGTKYNIKKMNGGYIHMSCHEKYIGSKWWHTGYTRKRLGRCKRTDDLRLMPNRILVGRGAKL